MKIHPIDYSYQVCPFCRSKNISPIAVVQLNPDQWTQELQKVQRTGYLCSNCQRYHAPLNDKHIIDRAEMRRDIKRLQAFLEAKT